LTAVHAGNALEHEERAAKTEVKMSQVDTDYLAELDVIDRLAVWREACKTNIQPGEAVE